MRAKVTDPTLGRAKIEARGDAVLVDNGLMNAKTRWWEYRIDAKAYQPHLRSLAETLAQKVNRELPKLLKPPFAAADIYMMLRQSITTYDLFFFINADERRRTDINWKPGYSVAILPLVRCMIDCLYNITTILENPGAKAYQYRASGLKLILDAFDADQERYGGDPKWDAYLENARGQVDIQARASGLTLNEVRDAEPWPTLGKYLRVEKGQAYTPHQAFLKKFVHGIWKEYSAMAHATLQGLTSTALFFTPDDLPLELRESFESIAIDKMISHHVMRVSAVLLCTLTEIQAHFRFGDARISQRIHEIWKVLISSPEIRELYDDRYLPLMQSKGINP